LKLVQFSVAGEEFLKKLDRLQPGEDVAVR
jgi:hypothetical protein